MKPTISTTLTVSMTTMASRFFVKLTAIFSPCVTIAAALALSFSAQVAAETETETRPIGEVSLLVGKAYLLKPDQSRQAVKQGSQIQVGDQILTQANGHVHIRFVDNAFATVRPDSRLEIISYDYDAQQPEKSLIKFELIEGITRVRSGAGAKAARSRFRLNTPVAAIGVRGTDFVVSATQQTTRALVNQGAIVVAPYSADCTAAAYGPCDFNAVELTDNSLQIIEFDGSSPNHRLIPAPHEREPGTMRQEVQLAVTGAENSSADNSVGTEVYLENVTSRKVTEQAVSTVAAELALPEFTPQASVASAALTSRQMVWGRWADGAGELERITLTYDEARDGREVTVGVRGSDYVLYRTEGDWPQIEKGLGLVSFSLNSAQAFYNSDSGVVAMQVNGGNLDIDFEQSLFATELNLNSIDTGFIDFVANGSISDRGYFNSRSASQRIAGAVSQDGTEAGYFFQQQLESGNIQGITLWDSQ